MRCQAVSFRLVVSGEERERDGVEEDKVALKEGREEGEEECDVYGG